MANDVARLAEERISAPTCRIRLRARDWFAEPGKRICMNYLQARKTRPRTSLCPFSSFPLPPHSISSSPMDAYVHMSICLFPFLFPRFSVGPCFKPALLVLVNLGSHSVILPLLLSFYPTWRFCRWPSGLKTAHRR
jgi:hypothetical protein